MSIGAGRAGGTRYLPLPGLFKRKIRIEEKKEITKYYY
jgi:hypothetical protein